MANSYSAQGSITIKRLRNGDTLEITLNRSTALYQGYNENDGTVSPDWTAAANQPVITPQATSMRGNAVTLTNHAWAYNGTALNFNGATSGTWITDSTGKFQMDTATGALKIIANLAGPTNMASDTLTYSATAEVEGVTADISKSIDILIQKIGANSYAGFLIATTEQLTGSVLTAGITAELYVGGTKKTSGFYTKWYKDNQPLTIGTAAVSQDGNTTITIGRDDVDGTQLFICEFYDGGTAPASGATPMTRAAVRIIDTLDEFSISLGIISANQEVDAGKPVTVQAHVVNRTTNSEVNLSSSTNVQWQTSVVRKSNWQIFRTVASDTITVDTTDTDWTEYETDGVTVKANHVEDVEVVAEVEWQD